MHRNCGFLSLIALAAVLVSAAPAVIFVEETINVGSRPQALVYDSLDHKIFVANLGSNSVSVINPLTNTVIATIPVDELPNSLCWSPTSNKVYVVCAPLSGNGLVTVINAATNEVITSIGVGQNPRAIAWCSARNKAYVVNAPQTGSVIAIDCASDQAVATIPFTAEFTGVDIAYNPTNDHVYASNNKPQAAGRLTAINCETDQVSATITCQSNTFDVEVNPVGNRIYAANTVSKTITVVNGSTNQRIGNIPCGKEPNLRWTPPNKLFVGEYWDSTVAWLHGDSLRIPSQNRIKINATPKNGLFIPRNGHVYFACDLSAKVVALDGRDGHEQVLATLDVGSGPNGMALYPDIYRTYVGNAWDSTVTEIRDEDAIAEAGKAVIPTSAAAAVWALPDPAPAGRRVSFHAAGFVPTRLVIRDACGRLVHAVKGTAPTWVVPGSGVYFCTLSDGARSAACKLTAR